jgi:hypothetical protein
MHGVGEPDVGPQPANFLGPVDRAHPVHFFAIGVLVARLRQMGMEAQPVATREGGQFGHCRLVHREWRAGRQRDAQHGIGRGVVIGRNESLGVGEDLLVGLHHIIGWKAAARFAPRHATAGWMKSNTKLAGRADFRIDEAAIRRAREKIKVIGRSGAARQQQFAQPNQGRYVNNFGRYFAPDFVKVRQPFKKLGVLHQRNPAGEGLEQVVVAVNEAGKTELARRIDDRGAFGRGKIATDRMDPVATDQHIAVGKLGGVIVKRCHATRIANEDMFCGCVHS